MLARLIAYFTGTKPTQPANSTDQVKTQPELNGNLPTVSVAPATTTELSVGEETNKQETEAKRIPETPADDDINKGEEAEAEERIAHKEVAALPEGDPIDVEEAELAASIRVYEEEIAKWKLLLERDLEVLAVPAVAPVKANTDSFAHKIIGIFKTIFTILKDLKEAIELPETFIDDKLADVRTHFTTFSENVDNAISSYNQVTDRTIHKSILEDICKDSILMLNDLRKLEIEMLSELKYVLSIREGSEKLVKAIPSQLSVFKDLIDDKVLEELTRNGLYLEVQDMITAVDVMLAEANGKLNEAKAFVMKNLQSLRAANTTALHANANALFTHAAASVPAAVTPKEEVRKIAVL